MANIQTSGTPSGPSQQVVKTLTFTGAAGAGAQGSMTALTISGKVLLKSLVFVCGTGLAGATSTVACGVSGNTSGLIAATIGTTITAGLVWLTTTATAGLLALPALTTNIVLTSNIILTIAVADMTGGTLVVTADYVPLTAGASLS